MVKALEWGSALAVILASCCLLLVYGYALGFAKASTKQRPQCAMTYTIPFKGTLD